MGPCAGIVVCVGLGALFSLTESTLGALTESLTRQLIDRGGPGSRALQAWLERRSRIIATLLVGKHLASISAAVLSVHVASFLLAHTGFVGWAWASALAVLAMTLVLLIFAELAPRTIGKQNAMRWAVPAIWLARLVEYPLLPPTWIVTGLARQVVRLLGGSQASAGPMVTEEDIEHMIEVGAREGVFETEERADLLEAVLEFGDTIAKEIMIPRTAALVLDSETPLREALDTVMKGGHSRVPIYRDSIDKVIGVLYAKDLLRAVAQVGISDKTIGPLARSEVFFVPETQRIAETLREMQRRRVHLGIVVDEFGGFSGIITLEDIVEELVGEIRDEYDREEELVRRVDDSTFLANALVSIHDLGALLEVTFPDDGDFETLGGFIVATAGRVPEVGAVIEWGGLSLEVLAADERRVERVRIVRRPHADGPSPEEPQP